MKQIIKYERTAHLVGSKLQEGDTAHGQVPVSRLVDGTLIAEEKLDGANCGINFDDDATMILQSRGHSLDGGAREEQFDLFKAWANRHRADLFDILGSQYLMYAEWMYAKHTVFYDCLPHYFMEFDILDKETGLFLDTPTRHGMLEGSPIVSVPVVHQGSLRTTKEVRALVKPSLYKTADWRASLSLVAANAGVPVEQAVKETDPSDLSEGLYFKLERDGYVVGRYKFVRRDFIQAILDSESHWRDRIIIPNRLADGVDIFV